MSLDLLLIGCLVGFGGGFSVGGLLFCFLFAFLVIWCLLQLGVWLVCLVWVMSCFFVLLVLFVVGWVVGGLGLFYG